MDNLPKTKARRKLIIKTLLLSMLICLITSQTAFAGKGKNISLPMSEIGGMLTTIVGVLGVVGIAFCGIKYLTGGANEAAQALKTAIGIAFAVGAIMVLPSLMQAGINIGKGVGWTPPHA